MDHRRQRVHHLRPQVRYCNTSDSDKDCYSDYDDWTTVSVSGGTARKRKISSLTNGDSYDVEVRANSNQGYSDWSSSSSGTPGAPAKPTLGTVTAGDDQFTVNWTAGASNGDDITYYEVSYCNETSGDCAAGTLEHRKPLGHSHAQLGHLWRRRHQVQGPRARRQRTRRRRVVLDKTVTTT